MKTLVRHVAPLYHTIEDHRHLFTMVDTTNMQADIRGQLAQVANLKPREWRFWDDINNTPGPTHDTINIQAAITPMLGKIHANHMLCHM